MDMDCMVLEDVELEPDLPARFAGDGGPQHLRAATSSGRDCVSIDPARPHFQSTAKSGSPRTAWFHSPASTAVGSSSWEAEKKQSRLCETPPGLEVEPTRKTAGAPGRTTAADACSSPSAACKKGSTTLRSSEDSLASDYRKKTVTASPSSELEGTADQIEPLSSSSTVCAHVLGFFTFVLCGVASLCCWQFLLALMPYIENTFFEGSPVGNSLMGVYQVGCICVQLILMFLIESMQPWLVIAATVCDAFLALIFPIVVSHGSRKVRVALTHLVALLLGGSAGMICGCCLAVASALPYNFIGAFSVGQGVAGVLSFVIGLAFNQVFDLGSPTGLSKMLWLVYGVSCFVSSASAYLILLALRQPWAARQLTRYWEAQRLRESPRRWTIMWRRWVGQPQQTACPESVTAFNRDSRQEALSHKPGCDQRTASATIWVGMPENLCAAVDCRAPAKQSGSGSICNSDLPACGCPRTCTADALSGINQDETEADPVDSASGSTQGTQLIQKADAERFPLASAPHKRNSLKAPADRRSRTGSDVLSGASEDQVQSSLPQDPEGTPRSKDEGSELWGENTSKKQRVAFQISRCSRARVSCEQHVELAEEEKHQPSRGWRCILRDSGIFLVCIFLNFCVTLNLYPRVGPIMWHYPSFPKNGSQYIILFGVFCIGDFFGKCIIDISKAVRSLSWLMIPRKLLLPVVISRLGIAVFFILGAYAASHWFFTNFALYVVIMCLLAVSNGWCATISLLYVCTSVERLEEREILGPASVLVLQLGIMAGAWTALAYPMP